MGQNSATMATRNASSSSTILLAIVLIITFPIWFAVGAALFGVVVGLFGAAIGVIAAIFGALVAVIVLPFKFIFGWGHWGWHDWGPFHHDHNGLWIIAFVIVVALIVRGRKTN